MFSILFTLNATPFHSFNANLRKVTVLHANHLMPATAALQREKYSCPLLCLHPSPVVTGDVI